MALFYYSLRLNPTVASTCLNCFEDTFHLLSLSQFSNIYLVSSLFTSLYSVNLYLILQAKAYSSGVMAFLP